MIGHFEGIQHHRIDGEQTDSPPQQSSDSSLLLNDDTQFYLSRDSPPHFRHVQPPPREQQQHDEESGLLLKIAQLIHELTKVKERMYVYEDYAKRLDEKNQRNEEEIKFLVEEVRKQEEEIETKNKTIDFLNGKLAECGTKEIQMQDKILALEAKIKQVKPAQKEYEKLPGETIPILNNSQFVKLKKKNKELSKINKILEQELNRANRKIIQIEKDVQNSTCEMVLGNIFRLTTETTNKGSYLMDQENLEKSNFLKGDSKFLKKYDSRYRAYSAKNY